MNKRLERAIKSLLHGVKFGVLLAALFTVATVASAQRGAGHAMHFSAPARSVAPRFVARSSMASRPIIIRPSSTPRTYRFSNWNAAGSPFTNFGQRFNNVPGLGFDYSHLAALNQSLHQGEFGRSRRFFRNERGGFFAFPFFDDGYDTYAEPAQYEQSPQVIYVQPPDTAAESADYEAPPPAEAQPEPPPLPDIGEFILVLRNGTRIEAVAFTRQSDRIVYVTKDGLRKSFLVSDFDSAATQQLNQQRGTPLQLPS
ncbi:MAG: hypothetical protein WBE20_15895 [Candidatus Acidiferrales bacterium]